ncbi:ABC transporter permease [Bacillus sp. FJAT-45037]|uniref:ABC transporter permease n=1 Tax=Bacillus sp. FJAT-45037 TaxID=2011007 RepID=UPI001E44AD20|nr:ABC transporter permease [Bacillus sp. FJAT-45037]
MGLFFRLLQNEYVKIYKRLGTWVMVGLLLSIVLIVGIMTKFVFPSEVSEDWRVQLETENAQMQESISNHPMMSAGKQYITQQVAINEYRLTHDLSPESSDSLWGFMIDATTFTGVVSLFTIVVAAGIVASEFTTGTIKLLLIRPVRRSKILLSKYITTLLFALFLLMLLFGASFIVGVIFFGYSSVDTPFLAYQNGEVIEKNMVFYIVSLFGFRSIDLIMMVTVAFMISTVFRSSSLAIGLSLFLMFTGPQIVQLLGQYDWVKYVLFANTDLKQYVDGTPLIEGMTMSFSVIMLLIYFIIISAMSWLIFRKRDVAV